MLGGFRKKPVDFVWWCFVRFYYWRHKYNMWNNIYYMYAMTYTMLWRIPCYDVYYVMTVRGHNKLLTFHHTAQFPNPLIRKYLNHVTVVILITHFNYRFPNSSESTFISEKLIIPLVICEFLKITKRNLLQNYNMAQNSFK